ncbi:nuclear transport factor 2 family protein [Microbacterium rhizomatis]|uniref:Nuclear transport factor 2 family protein n=1 Tax=Microbacterium rhizomatis TaxID=1631477 RepID=A0A5J5J2M7_9MICO|nr:nuclear transport factor 2 family protein [Microbacterium rhizomatis]KAA9106558.1 nuclear transport factor 2 family protein [Microbacterium rhizomatis]
MPDHAVSPTDAEWLSRAVYEMYDAYLTSDRARADSYIADDVTIWDTEHEPLVHGLTGLNALRNARPAGSVASVAGIDVTEPVVDVWGDTALVRHTFVVRFVDAAAAPERVRNTAVWQRRDGRWLVVHNHEDVLPEHPITPHTEKEEAQ